MRNESFVSTFTTQLQHQFFIFTEATTQLKRHSESVNGTFCPFETVKVHFLHHFNKFTELLSTTLSNSSLFFIIHAFL